MYPRSRRMLHSGHAWTRATTLDNDVSCLTSSQTLFRSGLADTDQLEGPSVAKHRTWIVCLSTAPFEVACPRLVPVRWAWSGPVPCRLVQIGECCPAAAGPVVQRAP